MDTLSFQKLLRRHSQFAIGNVAWGENLLAGINAHIAASYAMRLYPHLRDEQDEPICVKE